jgi:hypothetical membrane protein
VSGVPDADRATPVRPFFAATIGLIALYVVLDALAQILPPHYSPIRQPESDLAVGPYGYVMTVNFLVRGILSFLFLFGLWNGTRLGRSSRSGYALLGVWSAGAFVLAAFPTDVPPTPVSPHGFVHLLTALVAFVCVGLGEILLSNRFGSNPRLAPIRTPALALSVLVLISAFADFLGPPRIGGLLERIFLGLALSWMLFVAIYYLYCGRYVDAERTAPPSATASAPGPIVPPR